jgi:hypothetical protein
MPGFGLIILAVLLSFIAFGFLSWHIYKRLCGKTEPPPPKAPDTHPTAA